MAREIVVRLKRGDSTQPGVDQRHVSRTIACHRLTPEILRSLAKFRSTSLIADQKKLTTHPSI